MAAVPAAVRDRIRDADRSREAILGAAERLFAEHGYDGTSLNDIAEASGLSRATPSYFFGSKDQLYRDVLDRVFATRQHAMAAAFGPVLEWCEGDAGLRALRRALTRAAEGYMTFLSAHPSFVRLLMREELDGGARLRSRSTVSTAMQDAFAAVRKAGRARGLRRFDVDEAVLVFIALTFAPLSYRSTLMRAVRRDLDRDAGRRRQIELAVDQLMHLLAGDRGQR